ncbi:hypothetical protein TNCV_4603781 [Trichonephila clavipes]|nr:hypothetical protein TNCV_4603781 [Trichonephila clavipes]
MDDINFLHRENPQTSAGIEPADLGVQGHRLTSHPAGLRKKYGENEIHRVKVCLKKSVSEYLKLIIDRTKIPRKWLTFRIMAVVQYPKPIPLAIPVPKPKHNTAFVGFTRVDDHEACNTIQKMLESVIVEEWNKITTEETTKLV